MSSLETDLPDLAEWRFALRLSNPKIADSSLRTLRLSRGVFAVGFSHLA